MRDLPNQLEDVKARWMTGGSAAGACPEPWRAALGDRPDLDLLALAGQFTRLATRPAPAGPLAERPLLPRLALPPLPQEARALFRRCLAAKEVEAAQLVTLIAARGYSPVPTDWMPKPGQTDLPDLYAPWLDWLADAPGAATEDDIPTVESWDDWAPHARLSAVERLRASDPAAARELIAALSPTLAAEARHRLVSILVFGLAEADADYLASLEGDRSGKVQALAASLLARLGKARIDAEAGAEFTAFFETARAGLINRRTVVTARKLKSPAQRRRRAELAGILPVTALAEGLGLTVVGLVETWDFGDGTEEIGAMLAASGTDAEVEAFLARQIESLGTAHDLRPLFARIAPGRRGAIAPGLIAKDATTFAATADLLAPAPGTLGYDTIRNAPPFAHFESAVLKAEDTAARAVSAGFLNLGLIADGDAAARLIDRFTGLGLMAADPRLSLLRLNAALKEPPR